MRRGTLRGTGAALFFLAAALFNSAWAEGSPRDEAVRKIGNGEALTVDECVRVALTTNPSLLSSREQTRATEQGVLEAYSTFSPNVGANYGASRFSRILFEGQSLTSGEFDNFGVQLALRQTLFSWSGIKGIHRAKNSREAGRAGYAADRQDLIYQVRAACHDYLQMTDLLQVAVENLRVGEEQRKLAEKLKEVGAGVRADVLKAMAHVESNRLDVITAEKNLAVARASLLGYLGLDVTLPLELALPGEGKGPVPTFDECMRTAVENRPELSEMEYTLQATEDGVGAAWGEYLPSVTGSFAYEWNDDEMSADLFNELNRSWNARLSVNIPIFNIGTTSRIRQWKSNAAAAEHSLEVTRQGVAFEIQEALLSLEESEKKIDVAGRSVAAAEEDLRVSQGKYKYGLVPILNLIESQASLALARAARVEAIYGNRSARAALERATGIGR